MSQSKEIKPKPEEKKQEKPKETRFIFKKHKPKKGYANAEGLYNQGY